VGLAVTLLVPHAVGQALQIALLALLETTCLVVNVFPVILLVRPVLEQEEQHVLLVNPHWFSLVELVVILLVPLVAGQALQIALLVLRENTCLVVNVFPVILLVRHVTEELGRRVFLASPHWFS